MVKSRPIHPSPAGDRPLRPIFISDWRRALFIHYRIDPRRLQPLMAFELDLFGGSAWISLVAFTIARLRPAVGGRIGEWLLSPIGEHGFLNLRTYVRNCGEPGIYFIAEWLSNRLSCLLGPPTYGLPYRFAHIDYRHDHDRGQLTGEAHDARRGARFRYSAETSPALFFPSEPSSLDEFRGIL